MKFRAVIGIYDGVKVRQDIQSIDFDNDGHIIFINDAMYCVGEDAILEQYTGIKDVKRQEVYEGDVIEFTFRSLGAVHNYAGKLVFDQHMWLVETLNGDQFSLNRIADPYIIGNIHENPELLK